MSTVRINLKRIELDDYVFLARPCTEIPDETVRDLAKKARTGNLEFIGIVHGSIEVLNSVPYDDIIDFSETPVMSILVRNICGGLYSKRFMQEHGIEVRESVKSMFPDIDVLWQTFIFARRAMLVDDSVCRRVELDTVWIDDTASAFDVNRRYDYIKDVLMEDWKLWERWKSYFTLQRYRCYYEILHWMDEHTGWEFAERMVVELHRSRVLGEVDDRKFTAEERTALKVVDFDPGFLKKFYLGKVIDQCKLNRVKCELEGSRKATGEVRAEVKEQQQDIECLKNQLRGEREFLNETIEKLNTQWTEKLKNQKNMYENSTTFKMGKAIMTGPMTAKKAAKRMLGR